MPPVVIFDPEDEDDTTVFRFFLPLKFKVTILEPETPELSEPDHTPLQIEPQYQEVHFLPKPEGWKGDEGNPCFKTLGSLSPPVMRQIEPAGPHFLAYARRKRHGRTFSEDERIQAQNRAVKTEKDPALDEADELDALQIDHDPKEWKTQDHYEILGLIKKRWRATPAEIDAAHKKRRTSYHPDKLAARGIDDDGSRFKCIERAYEILKDPVKRRQYDSVDENADVEPPTAKEVQKQGFSKKWAPVFESEGRFSNIQPVPGIGDSSSTKEDVDTFYNFWYNFDSWRSFEYGDEDVPDDNEARDHKRHVEKKNANARRKKKTEDTARLRQMVDVALSQDERIKAFRQAEKANKNKKKNEREATAKREAEDKKKAQEEADRKKKESDETAKVEKAESKKAKEAAKNAVKKNRRIVKSSITDTNYLVGSGGTASPAQIDGVLKDVDVIVKNLEPDELATLVGKLNLAGKAADKVRNVYEDEAKRLSGDGKAKEGDFKILKL